MISSKYFITILISLKINDKIFQQITLIDEKSKDKLKENSDDLNAIIKLYYVMRNIFINFL